MTMLKLHNMAKTLKIKDKQIPQKNTLQKVLVDLDKLYNDFDETMMFPIIDIHNLINTYELHDIKSKKYVVCEYFLNFNKSIKNETRVNMFKVLFLDTYGILKQYESIKASYDLEIKRYTELEKEILGKLPELKPPTIPEPLLDSIKEKPQVIKNDFNKKLISEDTVYKDETPSSVNFYKWLDEFTALEPHLKDEKQQKVTYDTPDSRIPFIDIRSGAKRNPSIDIRYSNLKQSHDNYNKSIKDDNIIVNPITQQKVVSDASISHYPSRIRSADSFTKDQTFASEEYVDTELKKIVRSFDSKIKDCFDMVNAIKQSIEDKDSKIKNAVQECDNLIEKLNI